MLQRDAANLIKNSFSISYPFVYIKHSPEIARNCIKYMQKTFKNDILAETIFESVVCINCFFFHN